MPKGAQLDAATYNTIPQQALSLVGRGRASEAVELLRQVIAQLELEGFEERQEVALMGY
jgi:hypothetical protein